MIMEAVKRNVCRGVIFLMACLTCVVVFGSGLIAKATNYSPYAPYTTYSQKSWSGGRFRLETHLHLRLSRRTELPLQWIRVGMN